MTRDLPRLAGPDRDRRRQGPVSAARTRWRRRASAISRWSPSPRRGAQCRARNLRHGGPGAVQAAGARPALYFIQRPARRGPPLPLRPRTHRAKRKRDQFTNPLDEIAGIGPTRKRPLLLHFGTLKAIQRASLEDLMRCAGRQCGNGQGRARFLQGLTIGTITARLRGAPHPCEFARSSGLVALLVASSSLSSSSSDSLPSSSTSSSSSSSSSSPSSCNSSAKAGMRVFAELAEFFGEEQALHLSPSCASTVRAGPPDFTRNDIAFRK